MPSSSHQSLNSDPVNCVLLSMMILLGTPNLTTISWKNSLALAAVIVATGLASIHLVNLSKATKEVCVTTGRFLQGADHVETPDRKGPSDRDGLQFLRWHVYLPSEILASFTFADEFISICDSGWPKEPLPVGLSYQCS